MKITELAKSKPIVYCDMDGVLADLYGYAADLHDVAHYNDMTPDQWEKFFKDSDAYHLFRSISPFPNANKLLQSVKDQAGGYTILSSPLSFDREGSIKGKREWLKKHINVAADKHIFDHEKYNYAVQPDGTPNILIDDYGVNIDAWNKAGGIALKFQNDEDSLDTLINRLQKALKQDK
jgi:5'(3')-deoxyribonucleotidase